MRSVLIRFCLPALLAAFVAPLVLGAVFQKRPQALIEFDVIDLAGLPVVLLLVVGGLLVFVLPISRWMGAKPSKFAFLLICCLAGFFGGTLMAASVLLAASVGSSEPSFGEVLHGSAYIGGTLGAVSAAIWAVFNLPRKVAVV